MILRRLRVGDARGSWRRPSSCGRSTRSPSFGIVSSSRYFSSPIAPFWIVRDDGVETLDRRHEAGGRTLGEHELQLREALEHADRAIMCAKARWP